jgi:hypothetical protein
MLNENENIDQIFREKLGDYEKTPPAFLWTNIQGGLNAHRRVLRMTILKSAGIAAAIILAFLSGWWMTNPGNKSTVPQNSFSEQRKAGGIIERPAKENIINRKNRSADTIQIASNPSKLPSKENRTSSAKLSSLATFAANTSFIKNNDLTIAPKSGELELFENEKEFLDKLHKNFKGVEKLTDWIARVSRDTVTDTTRKSKIMIPDPFKYNSAEGSVAIAFNTPVRNNKGRWSLKAEFAPVFNSPVQNSGQRTDLVSNTAQNYNPQKTTTENTISGGMVAGYKVGKRLIVKSGIVYNNIRQTTRNIDFMGVNPLYSMTGNTTLASTPAGQVNLDKTGNTRSDMVANSNFLLASATKYSGGNELKQDIQFIEIPVQATYKLIDTKLNVGLTGGISTNILVGNKAILSENGERISTGETANMRSIVYSGAVGVEVGYEITNRITLTVEPRLKHFVNSLSSNKSVNYKPYQMGIVTGISYSFN